MLEEIRIRNFAIIDHLELEFASGFNVITGETGAGKSIIIDAVELLLGGKSDPAMVRAGAEKALIEGVFALDEATFHRVHPILLREELESDDSSRFITLTREMRNNGRSTARINGFTVNQEVLREVGEALIDIHGQSDHFSLLKSSAHIDLLDRYADLLEIREALATVVAHLQEVRREMRVLMEDEAALQRRAEQLRRDVEEIDAAELRPGEDDELKAERIRLSNSEQLATLSIEAAALLSGDDRGTQDGAVDQLQRVAVLLNKLAAIDDDLSEYAELADSISAQAQELALEMVRYGDEIEFDPERINDIEERLELINKLKRRYGVTIELILDHAETARTELNNIEHSEERLEELREKETMFLKQIGELGQNISKVRRSIGSQLSKRVVQELKDLRMERTQFEVALNWHDDPNGAYVGSRRVAFDATGIDEVEFLMSANPGEPLRPLAKVASGGEAARIMLSIKRVLSQADRTPTLIFDEVDQGIGGRVGSVVGEKLWSLTRSHQVLVVTHLPQLAGFADRHFHVRKLQGKDRTTTQVRPLDDETERIQELADMLGASGESGKVSARELLEEARSRKVMPGIPAASDSPAQGKLL
ncbi:MAG: DNA repair protein RecN [bacterium]|nr:DNA repair protein RecN [bacterium]